MSSATVKGTVKDFFIYLGLALVLYASLATVISLCFTYIEILVKDNQQYYYAVESLRWRISGLIVLFPLLLGLSYLVNKDIRRDPMKLEIRSRKWLLYSVTFVTSATITIDLVYLVYNFLGGDLAKEFILKSLTVLTIAGVVFAYYYQELKRNADSTEPDERKKRATVPASIKILGSLVSMTVVALVAFGFYTVGSPMTQRRHKQDEQRISDLYQIKNMVLDYYRINRNLPDNLEVAKGSVTQLPKDPETKELYEYKILNPISFELCASFKTERVDGETSSYLTNEWVYRPGRNCFPNQIEHTEAAK